MILLGADPLSRFLNRIAATPFAWGTNDCLLWLADWIVDQREVDPAYDFRGKYSTMLGAARIVRGAGGMLALVERRVTLAGLPRVPPGARGDIAIVSVGSEGGEHFGNQAGAILLGGSVALLSQTGLMFPQRSQVEVIMAWRV
jgi:hypothetical protein